MGGGVANQQPVKNKRRIHSAEFKTRGALEALFLRPFEDRGEVQIEENAFAIEVVVMEGYGQDVGSRFALSCRNEKDLGISPGDGSDRLGGGFDFALRHVLAMDFFAVPIDDRSIGAADSPGKLGVAPGLVDLDRAPEVGWVVLFGIGGRAREFGGEVRLSKAKGRLALLPTGVVKLLICPLRRVHVGGEPPTLGLEVDEPILGPLKRADEVDFGVWIGVAPLLGLHHIDLDRLPARSRRREALVRIEDNVDGPTTRAI